MKVVIAGGSGSLGRRLADDLARHGHPEPRCFYRISTARSGANSGTGDPDWLPNPRCRRIVGRMPRLQVYLPDDLYDELKRRELPASELLQVAVRAELERRDVLDATDDYLTALAAEVAEPTARQQARADAIVRRIRDRQLHQAG